MLDLVHGLVVSSEHEIDAEQLVLDVRADDRITRRREKGDRALSLRLCFVTPTQIGERERVVR